MKKPKAPKPTAEETIMRNRQTQELARLDEEENRRKRSIMRGRLGMRSLLSGSAESLESAVGEGPAAATSTGRSTLADVAGGMLARVRGTIGGGGGRAATPGGRSGAQRTNRA